MNLSLLSFTARGPTFLLGLIAGFVLQTNTRAAVPGADDTPVSLPPFIVEEAAKGPPWRYAETPGYEILSRCNDAITRRVVDAHHQLHQVLAEILPPQLQVSMSVPRVLVLYDEELQPAASQEVIARMLKPTVAPVDDPLPSLGRGPRLQMPVRRYNFLPNIRLWDRDGMAVFMIVRRDDFDPDQLSLTHDYVSFMVKSRIPALPPWFTYGFLALYQQMKFAESRMTLGSLEWISAKHTEALAKDPKLAPPVLPLGDFLSAKLSPRDPAADFEPIKAWHAQAKLFVRWGLDSGGAKRRAAFLRFVELAAIHGGTESVFRECFDMSFDEAHAQLAAYLPSATQRTISFKPARIPKLPPLILRNASDGQIARLKGDWERLEVPYVKAISPELATKYLEQARRTLKRAYDRGERDPRLLAVLGLTECDAGNDAGARVYLEAAAQIGSIRPRANYELARLRFAEFRANPAGAEGLLSPIQAVDVLKPLFAARASEPPLPEVYELIADLWLNVASTPTRGHLAVIDEGVRLFPRRTHLVLRGAELFLRYGYREEATTLVEVGTRLADNESTRERLATLQQKLTTK
jgi:hypothetical protein